jgi:recombinational DNA repair protein (RecF pathway)
MDKQCIKCGKTKPESDFYKSQRGRKCKECVLEITRVYKRNKRCDINFRKSEGVKQKVEANFTFKRAKARFQVVKSTNKLA